MQYVEYGKQHPDVVLLLHGGGLSWWNYRQIAQQLQDRFRVILPILDGHTGSDRDFTTIESNASEIISFIDTQLGGSVLLIGGLSLGAQVLLEMLSQRKDICRYAMVESGLVLPSRLTYALIKPAFGSSFGLIRKRWFSRLQFRSLRIRQELFEDYYRDTCGISKENMIAFLQENAIYSLKQSIKDCTAEIHIYVGQKENRSMRISARKLHDALPGSKLTILPGLYHGEFSINHADQYVQELESIIKNMAQATQR